eukprot:scaffold85322_cov36-Attheya_sp.AAC.2
MCRMKRQNRKKCDDKATDMAQTYIMDTNHNTETAQTKRGKEDSAVGCHFGRREFELRGALRKMYATSPRFKPRWLARTAVRSLHTQILLRKHKGPYPDCTRGTYYTYVPIHPRVYVDENSTVQTATLKFEFLIHGTRFLRKFVPAMETPELKMGSMSTMAGLGIRERKMNHHKGE